MHKRVHLGNIPDPALVQLVEPFPAVKARRPGRQRKSWQIVSMKHRSPHGPYRPQHGEDEPECIVDESHLADVTTHSRQAASAGAFRLSAVTPRSTLPTQEGPKDPERQE